MNNTNKTANSQYRVPNDLAREFLRTNDGVRYKPKTVQTYDSHLTLYTGHLHDNGLTILTAEFTDVIEFIEKCVRCGNRQSTLQGKLTSVNELYKYIRLRTEAGDKLQLDPLRFHEIDLDDYNTPEKIEREALSREEIRRLFDAFNSYRNRLMAIVGVETGIRNSDIRGLRLQDIHEDTIHVHDPKNSKPYDVPISEQLSFELDWWIDAHRNGFATAQESEYVFLSQHGGKLERNGSLNRIIKDAAKRAGLQEVVARTQINELHKGALNTDKKYLEWQRVTAHTLRHSFITLLEDAGVGLPYRQLVANHADPKTTIGYSSNGKEVVFNSVRERYNPPR